MKIGIIGCGNMGEAILDGIVSEGRALPRDIVVSDVDSAKLNRVKSVYKVDVTFNSSTVAKQSDVIIVAVKPQDISPALSAISGCLDKKKLLISIAAGVTIKRICSILGQGAPIVRVMPNMSVLIKMGFSAFSLSKGARGNSAKAARRITREIFGSIGDVVEVKENDLNAITAISGSGPAYFFYLVEVLIKSGVKLGLTRDTAKKAALKTAIGSAELLCRSGDDPSVLRKKVTSKGGTTEAAFKVFKKRRLEEIMHSGVKAAKERSKELSGGR